MKYKTREVCQCWGIFITLKEKRVLKQCLWGTLLENGAFFDKNGTILVPRRHQNEVVPPDKRAPFFKMVPRRHCFSQSGAL